MHAAGGSNVAEQALQRIAKLYAIEQKTAVLEPPQRMLLREQLALSTRVERRTWLKVNQRAVEAGTGRAKAIDQTNKRWSALQRYVTSGNLPIDNKPLENAIRPIIIGKKNLLFSDSKRVDRRAAAFGSQFATAKLNGPDPARWLADTLENSRIASIAGSTRCHRS